MFIEEIQKVDQLVFAPQNELKKPKYNKIKIFTEGWQTGVVLTQPPRNSSKQTLEEIRTIQKMYDATTPEEKEEYMLTDVDGSHYIIQVLDENDREWDQKKIDTITEQSKHVIRHYKNHYNRPRPFQVAQALGIDYDKYNTETSGTPSYPSGHTTQPYMVANYYGKLYPDLKFELREAADKSAMGRVRAGLHYPSDIRAGISLADQLIEYLDFDLIKEDAPMNSTGSAVSTDHPLQHSKTLYRRKNEKDAKSLYKLLQKRYN